MVKIRLISFTANPLETLWSVWEASKAKEPLPWDSAEKLRELRLADPALDKKIRDFFHYVLQSKLPVLENISFNFVLDGVSIALREQMVRHRIGTKYGERLGADIVPLLHDSTWWSQSMRIVDFKTFHQRGEYDYPKSIKQSAAARVIYNKALAQVEAAYTALHDMGVPPEDARMLLPLCVQHSISWTLNLAALLHIFGKRTCWVAQHELWSPVLNQMLDLLAEQVDPAFVLLRDPPCFSFGSFKSCLFEVENHSMDAGRDINPACPLWQTKYANKNPDNREGYPEVTNEIYKERKAHYEKFWRRNTATGEALSAPCGERQVDSL